MENVNVELESQQSVDAVQREDAILSYDEVQRCKRQKLQEDDGGDGDGVHAENDDADEDFDDYDDKDNHDFAFCDYNNSDNDDDDDAPTFPHFNKLPEKLLPIILNKLKLVQKVRTVPFVCKKWYDLWNSESALWRTMDFIPWQIRELELPIALIINKLRKRARPFLRELHFQFLDCGDLSYVLRRVGYPLDQLTVLNSSMTDEWANRFAHRLPNCKYLDLSVCNDLTEAGIQAFCQRCPSLKFLRIPPKGLRRQVVRNMIHGVQYNVTQYYVLGNRDPRLLMLEDKTWVLHPH